MFSTVDLFSFPPKSTWSFEDQSRVTAPGHRKFNLWYSPSSAWPVLDNCLNKQQTERQCIDACDIKWWVCELFGAQSCIAHVHEFLMTTWLPNVTAILSPENTVFFRVSVVTRRTVNMTSQHSVPDSLSTVCRLQIFLTRREVTSVYNT